MMNSQDKNMKAIAVVKPGKTLIVNDVLKPEIKEYEALVRIRTCGFCNGTDMQIINGTITEEEGLKAYPTLLGHEGCGEVIKLGSKVRNIKIGDKFIRPDTPYNYGKYTCTYGNMAEYAVATDRQAMKEDGIPEKQIPSDANCTKIPDEITFEDGAVMLSLLECYSAVKNFRLQPGMDVLVFGAGPMGLGVVGCLNAIGAGKVVLVDAVEERLAYAREHFNVDRTINITTEKIEDVVERCTFDAVMDLVGSSKVLMEGTHYLKQGGTLCGMGVLRKDDALINVTKLQNNTSLHMLNLPYRRMNYINEITDLIQQGKIHLKHFYSHVLPAEEIEECLRLINSKEALKVVLTF